VTLVLLATGRVAAQVSDVVDDADPTAEFHFVRLMYNDAGGGRGGWGRRWGSAWTDWPDAEYHLMEGIRRLTRVDGQIVDYNGGGARRIRLDNDRLFEFPWLYAVEVGHWYLDESDAALLREYLLRGGFMVIDDFHGDYEWPVLSEAMGRILPGRAIVDIPDNDMLMQILFSLDNRTQIPGQRHIYGQRMQGPPRWAGIYDDENRLMVAINFNIDMGDAWEHADDPGYPAPMTGTAYRFGVNYVIYAMTH
jgi:hypothetical protein